MVLRDIESVHRPLGIAPPGKPLRESEPGVGGIEKITADREDHVGLCKIIGGAHPGPEQGVEGRLVRSDRLVAEPKHLRELTREAGAKSLDGGGVITAYKDGKSFAAVGIRGGADSGEEVVEVPPANLEGVVGDLLGTVRIVEIKDGSLGKGIGGSVASAAVEGMKGIPLDFHRASVGRGHDDRNGSRRGGHGAGVVEELARDRPLGGLGEGNKMRLGTTATRQTHPGERRGGSHEPYKIASG